MTKGTRGEGEERPEESLEWRVDRSESSPPPNKQPGAISYNSKKMFAAIFSQLWRNYYTVTETLPFPLAGSLSL